MCIYVYIYILYIYVIYICYLYLLYLYMLYIYLYIIYYIYISFLRVAAIVGDPIKVFPYVSQGTRHTVIVVILGLWERLQEHI